MPLTQVRRPVISAQLLTQLGIERGMSMPQCLRGTGIDPRALADPRTEVMASQELQLIRNVLSGLGPVPGLGLDAGLSHRLSSYGIWGFALLSSPTFRSATEIAVRYLDLSYTFGRFRLEPQGQDLLLILDDKDLPQDVYQFMVERDLAAWANAAWEIRPGGFPAKSAQLRFARPAYGWRFDKICGARPVFDAPINAILLGAESLETPLPQANAGMARLCEEQCRRLLARRRVRSGVAGQVRDRLSRSPAEMPSFEQVASELHVATRSLRRRLEEEGTSFRGLLDEVRQALAEELLSTSHMKLEEIATRLSYAEPATFISAFKRWTGVSPTAYRIARRAQAERAAVNAFTNAAANDATPPLPLQRRSDHV